MTDAQILSMVQMDLGELNASTQRLTWLSGQIESAKLRLKTNGIILSEGDEYPDDQASLIAMYAAYLVRFRSTGAEKPRMLRDAIHDMLFSQKASVIG